MKRLICFHFFRLNFLFLIVLTITLATQQTVSRRLTAKTEIVQKQKTVFVLGAVVKAGTFLYDESGTVLKAIEKAGGLSADADIGRIEICRRTEGGNKDNNATKSFLLIWI